MPVRWFVDTEATLVLWRELSEMPLRLVDRPGGWVADLGGGNGNFVRPLTAKGARPVSIDPDGEALRGAPVRGVRPVRGSALDLPIRGGSLDALAGRAVLHHVPDDLDAAMLEVRRGGRAGGPAPLPGPPAGSAR